MYVMIASHDGGHRPVVPVLATSTAHPTTTTETARRFDFCIDCETIKTKTKTKSLYLLYRIDQYVSYYHLAQADEIAIPSTGFEIESSNRFNGVVFAYRGCKSLSDKLRATQRIVYPVARCITQHSAEPRNHIYAPYRFYYVRVVWPT